APDRIFNVVAVESLIAFELLAPIGVSPGVVVGDAALPMARFSLGLHGEIVVEILDGLGEFGELELSAATQLIIYGLSRIKLDQLSEVLNGFLVSAKLQ